MALTKSGYAARIIDEKIADYLGIFGALLIEGPKWCGKTWTSLNHANSVVYLMDPGGNDRNRERARLNPVLVLEGEAPRAVDEWQEVPGIWDAVRFKVDQEPEPGRFILTGSATPPRESYSHSGAGRMAVIRMRPMSLFESGDSTGAISFEALVRGQDVEPVAADIALTDLIDITIRGGWPQTLRLPLKKAGAVSLEYLHAIENNELFNDDFSRRNPQKLRKLIRALARSNATTVANATLAADIDGEERRGQSANEVTVSRETATAYIEDLKKIFVIEDIPGWDPQLRSKTKIRMSPKRVFADPSLAVAALRANRAGLLKDLNTFGFMFENLCLRDLAVYAERLGGSLCHYRDNSGLEVDAIVEMPDGSWCAFEIKLGEHQVAAAAENLRRFRGKMVSGGAKEPLFMAVITGGGLGRCYEEGIFVLPINALAP
jgi:predicted AAA+ superfamily ATPase